MKVFLSCFSCLNLNDTNKPSSLFNVDLLVLYLTSVLNKSLQTHGPQKIAKWNDCF